MFEREREREKERERGGEEEFCLLAVMASEVYPIGPLGRWHHISSCICVEQLSSALLHASGVESSLVESWLSTPLVLYLCFKRVLRHGAYVGTQHGFFLIVSVSST